MAEESAPAEGAAPQETDNGNESPATGEDTLGDAGKQALDRMKAERNEASKRAKSLERELTLARQANMNESEKAIAEAEARGRSTASVEFGKRLARTQFDALAGRRNPDVDTSSVLEYVDLARFVSDDGEPDDRAIAAAVERLVPAAADNGPARAPFDLGNRGAAAPSGNPMNDLIRSRTGRR